LGVVLAEVGRGHHGGHGGRDTAPLQLVQHGLEVGAGLRRTKAPQHVVGAQADDHEVRLARQAVEGEGHPGEACGGGVPRDAGVDHPRPDALLRQGPLQGGREALRGLEAVAGEQAVAKGHDKGAFEARLRQGRLLCPGGLPGGGTGEDKLAKPGHDHI